MTGDQPIEAVVQLAAIKVFERSSNETEPLLERHRDHLRAGSLVDHQSIINFDCSPERPHEKDERCHERRGHHVRGSETWSCGHDGYDKREDRVLEFGKKAGHPKDYLE